MEVKSYYIILGGYYSIVFCIYKILFSKSFYCYN